MQARSYRRFLDAHLDPEMERGRMLRWSLATRR